MTAVTTALDGFVQRALLVADTNSFTSHHDPEWLSPAITRVDGSVCHWQPVPQTEPLDFSGLANAAEAQIHPDIQAYYGSFWSGTLQGATDEGPVSLIQLWNSEDFERLIENLVGHLFMKIRSKQPFTVFFANTEEDSELFLSIDNQTGKVLLEEPGKPPIRVVDPDVATFLNRLVPDTSPPKIY